MTSIYTLPDLGNEVILSIHHVIREDAQQLFGFVAELDRSLFRALIKINGVGPKLALTILSGISAQDFAQHVQLGDSAALKRIPGIGNKTAERLILEMRSFIEKLELDLHHNDSLPISSALQDALDALIALGYKENDARKTLQRLDSSDKTSDILIREALQEI